MYVLIGPQQDISLSHWTIGPLGQYISWCACLSPSLACGKLYCLVRLKFHLARLDSTRLDTFDFVEPVEQVETSVSSETSRALPTWRTTNDLVQV